MEAVIQHIGFIRPSDVSPEEWEVLEYAKQFVAKRRPPASETQGLGAKQERTA